MVARLVVCGRCLSPAYQEAKHVAAQLQRIVNDQFSIETVDVLDLDWPVKLKEIQLIYGAHIVGECQDLLAYHTTLGFVAHNVAELQDWAANRFQLEPPEGQQRPDYQRLARESLRTFCKSRAKDSIFVFMKFDRDGLPLGTIVFELFKSLMPKTCENFRLLCTGDHSYDGAKLHYLQTPIHRIVKDAWIQGGDIVGGNGDRTRSAVLTLFEDESFTIKHDRAGILSMANEGEPHTNGSQFFITLRDLKYLDYKKVAFGRVIDGLEVLNAIGTSTTCNERPEPIITISDWSANVHCEVLAS